jgi:oxygen-independent coproporphyrinogen-3 oxidase
LVEAGGNGTTREEVVGTLDRAREALLMGLRLAEGIAFERFAARTGTALLDAVEPVILQAAIEEGYLVLTATHLAATAEGRKRLDALLPALAK